MFKRITALAITAFVAALGVVPTASAYEVAINPPIKEYFFGFSVLGAMAEYGNAVLHHATTQYIFSPSDCPQGFKLVSLEPRDVIIEKSRLGLSFEALRTGGTNVTRKTDIDYQWSLDNAYLGTYDSEFIQRGLMWREENTEYWGWKMSTQKYWIHGSSIITANYPATTAPIVNGPATYTGNDWLKKKVEVVESKDENVPICRRTIS